MSDIKKNLKFLKRLQGENGITEISDLTHNLGGIEKYEDILEAFPFLDLYFISFVPNEKWYKAKEESEMLPRTKNEYVGGINYFRADFDIRSNHIKYYDRNISDEELMERKDVLLEALNRDELLSTYNAVVLSGNGVHVYRIGKTIDEVDPKAYSAASTKLYDKIKDLRVTPDLRPDYSCGNVGRMLRLPGSINHKQKFGMPPREVELLMYKEEDSPLVEQLYSMGKDLALAQSVRVETLKQDMEERCIMTENLLRFNFDTYDKIDSLNIADLVCFHTGWTLAENGVNFISNNDGKYTGAYVIPEENVVVHMGTPHFSDHFKVYSPFSFLMVHYGNNNPRDTFRVAEEMFPEIKSSGKFYIPKKKSENERSYKYYR